MAARVSAPSMATSAPVLTGRAGRLPGSPAARDADHGLVPDGHVGGQVHHRLEDGAELRAGRLLRDRAAGHRPGRPGNRIGGPGEPRPGTAVRDHRVTGSGPPARSAAGSPRAAGPGSGSGRRRSARGPVASGTPVPGPVLRDGLRGPACHRRSRAGLGSSVEQTCSRTGPQPTRVSPPGDCAHGGHRAAPGRAGRPARRCRARPGPPRGARCDQPGRVRAGAEGRRCFPSRPISLRRGRRGLAAGSPLWPQQDRAIRSAGAAGLSPAGRAGCTARPQDALARAGSGRRLGGFVGESDERTDTFGLGISVAFRA